MPWAVSMAIYSTRMTLDKFGGAFPARPVDCGPYIHRHIEPPVPREEIEHQWRNDAPPSWAPIRLGSRPDSDLVAHIGAMSDLRGRRVSAGVTLRQPTAFGCKRRYPALVFFTFLRSKARYLEKARRLD